MCLYLYDFLQAYFIQKLIGLLLCTSNYAYSGLTYLLLSQISQARDHNDNNNTSNDKHTI